MNSDPRTGAVLPLARQLRPEASQDECKGRVHALSETLTDCRATQQTSWPSRSSTSSRPRSGAPERAGHIFVQDTRRWVLPRALEQKLSKVCKARKGDLEVTTSRASTGASTATTTRTTTCTSTTGTRMLYSIYLRTYAFGIPRRRLARLRCPATGLWLVPGLVGGGCRLPALRRSRSARVCDNCER